MIPFQFAFVKTAQMTPFERSRFLGADHFKRANLLPGEYLVGADPNTAGPNVVGGAPVSPRAVTPTEYVLRQAATTPTHAPPNTAKTPTIVGSASVPSKTPTIVGSASVPSTTPTHVPPNTAKKGRAGLIGALLALGGTGAAAGTYAVRRKRQRANEEAAALAQAKQQAELLERSARARRNLALGGALGLAGLGLSHFINSEDT